MTSKPDYSAIIRRIHTQEAPTIAIQELLVDCRNAIEALQAERDKLQDAVDALLKDMAHIRDEVRREGADIMRVIADEACQQHGHLRTRED